MGKEAYGGWPNCLRLSNGLVDLVVTTDVGPRIIRFGFVSQVNEVKEYAEMLGRTSGDEWRIYGGHRLWHAPEAEPRSYSPDNGPVAAEEIAGGLRLTQPTEGSTGIQKQMEIRLDPSAARVQVTHRLINRTLWPLEMAPWALSVMAQGGKVIIPLPPRGTHPEALAPVNTLTMWAYTDMSDPRWTWGRKYIMLRQDPAASAPQKVGAMVPAGWVAYANHGHLFVKCFAYSAGAAYVDYGCSVETFTNADMLEVETLGPLSKLAPGAAVEHVEEWRLFDGVPMPVTDADVDRSVAPLI